MRQYEMYQLEFEGSHPNDSQVEIDLTAEFEINGKTNCVKGFYAGNGKYIVRFLPKETGKYRYKISGIVQSEGEEICEPAVKNRHGIVRTADTHFKYEDGTWYYPFGTTVYALLHQEETLINETMTTLKKAPFNKIRICVFPKSYDYNTNDPEYYAFEKTAEEWDVHRPCFAFWDKMEQRIKQLDQMGIQCDLILFHPYDRWGFAEFPREKAMVYLDYLIRRLSAFPNIWWSLANEYDLMKYEQKDWETFAHFIHENDSYGHLLSNHHMVKEWDFANKDTTHICVQIKDVDHVCRYITKFNKPMMVDECRYEGNVPMEWGNISAFEMVNRFWKVCTQGAYCTHGETYLNKEEILWWSKGGRLRGESPARIGFLREIMESFPGPLTYANHIMTIEEVQKQRKNPPKEYADSPIFKSMMELPEEVIIELAAAQGGFYGRYEKEIYLKYYERQCTCIGTLELPDDEKYEVEVLDVWEMTRKKVMSNVSGDIKVDLPGKEGIAILARRSSHE